MLSDLLIIWPSITYNNEILALHNILELLCNEIIKYKGYLMIRLLKEIDHKVTDQRGNWDKAHQALGDSPKNW